MPSANTPGAGISLRLRITAGAAAAPVLVLLAALGLALASAALAGTGRSTVAADGEGVSIVVTTAVLGSVVTELVGDRAEVNVLMAGSMDPHHWQPSARDIERLLSAHLVVTNGLDLEEGLHTVLDEAAAAGVRIFEAADYIEVRGVVEDDEPIGDEMEAADDEHEHGALDPHFWVDPVAMVDVVSALTLELAELGLDVTDRGSDMEARLLALDAQVRSLLEPIPVERRKLVTGHESMGYFAERYGFELIGSVIPGLSSQGEVSARALADLAAAIRQAGVPVVFTERGTPQAVVEAIAAETGASVVEIPSYDLPDDGSYFTFMRQLAISVAGALA